MAEKITYISLENLGQYNELVLEKIGAESAKALKNLVVLNDEILGYKSEVIPTVEVDGKVVYDKSKADAVIPISSSDVAQLKLDLGTVANLETTSKVAVGAINEVKGIADANAEAIETLNGDADTEGSIKKAVKDLQDTLADVATSGNASDVAVADSENVITATNVEGALTEIAKAVSAVDATVGKATDGENAGTGLIKRVEDIESDLDQLGTASEADVATVAIGATGEKEDSLPTVKQVKDYIATEVAGLEGALHYLGIKTSTDDVTDPKAGDVVIVGSVEYIYNGTKWEELGDQDTWVTKNRQIAGIDLVDDITATELKTALDIDDIESAIGTESTDTEEATGIYKRIEDLENSTDLEDVISSLDSTVSTATAEDADPVLNISVTETDGKLTAITASVKAETFDAYGAASDVQGETTKTVKDIEDEIAAFEPATEDQIKALFAPAQP